MTQEKHEARHRSIRGEYLEEIWGYEGNGGFEDARGCRKRMNDELESLNYEYGGRR